MKTLLAAALIPVLLLFSCGRTQRKENTSMEQLAERLRSLQDSLQQMSNEKKIGTDFSMRIPASMHSTTELNDDACLQYMNAYKETYCIVISESKSSFVSTFKLLGSYDDSKSVIENYFHVQMKQQKGTMRSITKQEPVKKVIHGLKSVLIDYDGVPRMKEIDIAYRLAFIEGDENVYMVMTWTLLENKSACFDDYMEMIESFKLLHPYNEHMASTENTPEKPGKNKSVSGIKSY